MYIAIQRSIPPSRRQEIQHTIGLRMLSSGMNSAKLRFYFEDGSFQLLFSALLTIPATYLVNLFLVLLHIRCLRVVLR